MPSREGWRPLPQAEGPPEIPIIADDSTNSLVIRTLPRNYRKSREAIERLDILPLRVLRRCLRRWPCRTSYDGDGVVLYVRRLLGDASPSVLVACDVKPPGFSPPVLRCRRERGPERAREGSEFDVISSPQLLVLDNQTARMQANDQMPIVHHASPNTGDLRTIMTLTELCHAGVILTPRRGSMPVVS